MFSELCDKIIWMEKMEPMQVNDIATINQSMTLILSDHSPTFHNSKASSRRFVNLQNESTFGFTHDYFPLEFAQIPTNRQISVLEEWI